MKCGNTFKQMTMKSSLELGTVSGYQALVEALLDPEHSEFEALGDWIPPGWGPELFKAKNVRFDNPTRRWKRAFLVEG